MKKIMKLSILGLTEELTIDFRNLEFQDTIIQLFKKSIEKDYFDSSFELIELFEPKTNMHFQESFIKIDSERLEIFIVNKLKNGNPDDVISPFSKTTLFEFIKMIFSSILWDKLGDTLQLVATENFTPSKVIEEKTNIKLKGITKNETYGMLPEKSIVPIIE